MEIIKNIRKNTFILLTLTIVILYVILKDNLKEIINSIKIMDYRFILVAILLYFMSIIIKACVVYKTVNQKEQFSLLESIKHSFIVQFFNGITPFSTGGQPMEIYMLKEHIVSYTKATNIIIQNFIFYQTALVIFGIVAVTYNYMFHLLPENLLLKKLVLIGFIINTLVAVGLFIITFSKKLTKKISKIIIKILSKINIIKNKEKITNNWNKKLDEFHESAKILRKNKKLFIFGVVMNIISLTLLYIIPLLIVYSLKDYNSINIIETLTSSAYVLIIGAFVPIPGATGGIEFGFLEFFGNFLSKKIISTVLLIWRFITYYLGMIIGALAFSMEKKEVKK